jgi:hypothetical protein
MTLYLRNLAFPFLAIPDLINFGQRFLFLCHEKSDIGYLIRTVEGTGCRHDNQL